MREREDLAATQVLEILARHYLGSSRSDALERRSCDHCGQDFLPGEGKKRGLWKAQRFCSECSSGTGSRYRRKTEIRACQELGRLLAARAACEARDREGLAPTNWKRHLAGEISRRTGTPVTAKWVTRNWGRVAGAMWPPKLSGSYPR
jgi:hypothetical protein